MFIYKKKYTTLTRPDTPLTEPQLLTHNKNENVPPAFDKVMTV